MVEDINQAIYIIKQLLERMVIPPAQPTSRLRSAIERSRVEQQVAKATTRGNATSNCCANSQQVFCSWVESTRLATTIRRKHDEVGPSRPQNISASGRTTRPDTVTKSREREPTEDALRPLRNIFERLGRSRGEDMRTHLEARRNSMTSKRREDLLIVSPINDEINELRARLEKLEARNTKANPSTSTSPFSMEI